MKEARFEFRCRRCNEVTQNPCTSEPVAHSILIALVCGQKEPNVVGGPVGIASTHRCKDGGCGFADLIGYAVRGQ